jgi:hypothetical protein
MKYFDSGFALVLFDQHVVRFRPDLLFHCGPYLPISRTHCRMQDREVAILRSTFVILHDVLKAWLAAILHELIVFMNLYADRRSREKSKKRTKV